MRLPVLATVCLFAVLPCAGAAQATRDQVTIVFTVAPAYVIGTDLWRVPNQPLQSGGENASTDLLNLSRTIRSNVGLQFSGIYWTGNTFGIGAEAFLLGLGYRDSCRLLPPFSGAVANQEVCDDVNNQERGASAVAVSIAPILRFNSRKIVSPYARLNLGLLFSNQSPLEVTGQENITGDPDLGPTTVFVYSDDDRSRITPSLGLGVGFTAAITPSYQVRWEIRDNIVGVDRITGPTSINSLKPPSERAWKHLLSFSVGFDVVLERRRGRRY